MNGDAPSGPEIKQQRTSNTKGKRKDQPSTHPLKPGQDPGFGPRLLKERGKIQETRGIEPGKPVSAVDHWAEVSLFLDLLIECEHQRHRARYLAFDELDQRSSNRSRRAPTKREMDGGALELPQRIG